LNQLKTRVADLGDGFQELQEEITDIRENWDEEMRNINAEIQRRAKTRGIHTA
jgi:hypothetical protein